ncbi:MAG: 16S rRNA (cytosine(1402)-N(4))-methyltransferase RsmH [Pseudomonadota bacterium]
MSPAAHEPVLLEAVLSHLSPVLEGTAPAVLDATFGRGGHARALLAQMPPGGRLLVLDRDPEALAVARQLAAEDGRVQVLAGRFSELSALLERAGLPAVAALSLDAVLADLGVSSPQLDDAGRGFSLRDAGPLDMRMDPTQGMSAADWLAVVEVDELTSVLRRYGEQGAAARVARAIVAARPFTDTAELAEVVATAMPAALKRRSGTRHPATQVFQAIRIHINDELGEIERALPLWFSALRLGGRLAVISFHSLEDRLVKQFFRAQARPPALPRRLPVTDAERPPAPARLLTRALRPAADEQARNRRSRSATLRVLERAA